MERISQSLELRIALVMFLTGLVLGSQVGWPIFLIIYLLIIWLIVRFTVQKPWLRIVSASFCGCLSGFLVWQLTDGAAWLAPNFLATASQELIKIRDQITDRLFLALPEPHGSLLVGIIFGSRVSLDRDLIEQIRIVGLSHIVAVSGYNLSILVANIRTLLLPFLGRNTIWICLVIIATFVIITGAPSSILRASVMASLVLIGLWIGRPSQPVSLILLAAAGLAIFEPKIIFEIGFQLSIVATYAVMRVAPLMQLGLSRIAKPTAISKILTETLSATLLTAPLIAGYFGVVSIISPLTNLVVVPLIPITMAVGLIASLVTFISEFLSRIIALLSWPILEWLRLVVETASQWQFSQIDFGTGWPVIIGLLLSIFVTTEYLAKRYRHAL